MKAKGEAQHAEGTAQVKAAQTQQQAESMGDGAKGNVKNTVGKLTGNEHMRAEGQADKASGAAKDKTNF